ncbi:MAG: hypothetical protein ACTSP2_03870 [Alphaproteobacteria bacterium]
MMRIHLAALLATMLAAAAPAHADDRETVIGDNGRWGVDGQISSAELARGGWRFMAMSSMSWPDGRQALVTMWISELGDFARCFDYFDAQLVANGGKCERSGNGL